jgi:hypothetical protein
MTWKLTVFSHLNSNSVDHALLERYANNDKDLSLLHATDSALIKRNGAQCNGADVDIVGQSICFDEINEAVQIHLTSKWPLENKASKLIRHKLDLSSNEYEKKCAEGKIICLSGHNLKKCKMNGMVVIQIEP